MSNSIAIAQIFIDANPEMSDKQKQDIATLVKEETSDEQAYNICNLIKNHG